MSGTVADVMTTAPIVVEVPGSRSDAINIMVRNGLTGLPVIRASDGKLMGVVSRRDVFRNFEEDQLSLIMKKGCITVTPETTVEEAAAISAPEGSTGCQSSTAATSWASSRPPTSSASSRR